jgi:hypothetical protein
VDTRAYNIKKGEGAFRTGAKTGLVAGVTTGSSTNGHLWALRWAPNVSGTPNPRRQFAAIKRFRARWFTISGFTAAQEVGLDLFRVTSYTAAHSGGTGAAALTPSSLTRGNPFATSPLMAGRIAGSDQLTAGTQTFDTDPIASGAFAELAAAATVPKGLFELFMSTEDLLEYPLILAPNEGLVLRNTIAQGAGGTARIVVECDWLEVERY